MKNIIGRLALLLPTVCYGIYLGSMKWLKVKTVDIPSEKIDLKILLIADLHSNSKTKMNLDIWKKINEQAFDIAVITGDVIINLFEELNPHIRELRALAQKVPVFFVEGNHEIGYKDEICELCANIGIKALYNENVTLKIGKNTFFITGLRDYYMMRYKRYSGLKEAFHGVNGKKFNLVLCHQPQIFDKISDFEFDLQLSGHTHGGQLRLPFFPTLYAPAQGIFPRYGDGLFKKKW